MAYSFGRDPASCLAVSPVYVSISLWCHLLVLLFPVFPVNEKVDLKAWTDQSKWKLVYFLIWDDPGQVPSITMTLEIRVESNYHALVAFSISENTEILPYQVGNCPPPQDCHELHSHQPRCLSIGPPHPPSMTLWTSPGPRS